MTKGRSLDAALALIVAAYLALAIAYGIANPIFESPDERFHLGFVRYLVTEHTLPVMTPDGGTTEYHQPPLYYLVGAAATFWIDTQDAYQFTRWNPFWGVGTAAADVDNRNQFFHDERENFPYHGAVLAVHLLRFVSTIFGALTVILTYLIAAQVFPSHRAVSLGAAALVAFNPQFIYNTSSVNNDSLITVLCTAVLLALMRWRVAKLSLIREGLTLGLLLSAALLAKSTGVLLIFPVGLALAFLALRDGSLDRALKMGSIIAAVAAPISGWWFVRNVLLYGEWSGMDTMQRYWAISRVPPLDMVGVLRSTPTVWRSFWGYFGSANVLLDQRIYLALLALASVSAAGLLVGGIRFVRGHSFSPAPARLLRSGSSEQVYQLTLMIAWLALIILALARFMQSQLYTEFGRYLFPAIASIAVLIIVGLIQLVPNKGRGNKGRGIVVGAIAVALLGLSLAGLFVYLIPAYARPEVLSERQWTSLPHPTSINFGDFAEIVGYEVRSGTVAPGQTLAIDLYWHCKQKMDKDYAVFVQLLTLGDKKLVGQRDIYPGGGNFPTSAWLPGVTFRDTYHVTLSEAFVGPAVLRIDAGLYSLDSKVRLPLLSGQAGYGNDAASLGLIKVLPPLVKLAQPSTPSARFDDGVELAGSEIDAQGLQMQGERNLKVKLLWTTESAVKGDYTVFVHLVDGKGQPVAQHDGKPLNGNYPTSAWGTDEIVADTHILALPPDLPPGSYRILAGLYDLATMRRLAIASTTSQDAAESAFEVGMVTIK